MKKYVKTLALLSQFSWVIVALLLVSFLFFNISDNIENSDQFAYNYDTYGGYLDITSIITVILIFLIIKYGIFFYIILEKCTYKEIDQSSFLKILLIILSLTLLFILIFFSMEGYSSKIISFLLLFPAIYYFTISKEVKTLNK